MLLPCDSGCDPLKGAGNWLVTLHLLAGWPGPTTAQRGTAVAGVELGVLLLVQ